MNFIDFLPFLIIMGVVYSFTRGMIKIFGPFYIDSKTSKELMNFYEKHIYYFGLLNDSEKRRFISRAYSLLHSLRIDGRNDLKITMEVRLFVAAAYVQLTFGLRRFILPNFKRFIIYPDSYVNPFTGRLHEGEVNPRGVIVLSWKQLLKGYANPSDRINLGLHEMAHALFITIRNKKMQNQVLEKKVNDFAILALVEINRVNTSQEHFLRKYAGNNVSEFFAVSVENFFEAPAELNEHLPKIYNSLSELLNQDPINKVHVIDQKAYR